MSKGNPDDTGVNVRLDKWLWAARFFKTRGIAREMVQAGKVHYNGQRAKPGKTVEPGAMVKVPAGWDIKEVEVLKTSDKRLSASLAQALYKETEKSIAQREANQTARKLSAFHSPRPEHRPDKKQRRQIIKFKQQ
ncbi:ribosome-associated heat shock protein Hsp15 [Alteromonas sp. C1M14]|uniref:ribosome-associated heat shock protein Hsp15 n=1 Tax=Alteromonas sp. C1M14 TaxID=2841567 RepID=UPI001C0888FB|nr:ribosome-associated heat shock protein Hsp15 [Alteromonas sp. C1M14]MBU2978313.1 ribosome-associated heat shock protein Hsp15 [Alteromonas sp. C1M14]